MNDYDWLSAYQEPMQGSRKHFHYQLDELATLPQKATIKYTENGKPKRLPGLSLVYWAYENSSIQKEMSCFISELQIELTNAGLENYFAFLPMNTCHMTIADIILYPYKIMERNVLEITQNSFKDRQGEALTVPTFYPEGVGVCAGTSLVVWCTPQSQNDLEFILNIRRNLSQLKHLGEEVLPGNMDRFIGHMSLAYIVRPILRDDYKKFKLVIHQFENRRFSSFKVTNAELRKFNSMEDWENPVFS